MKILVWEAARFVSLNIINWSGKSLKGNKTMKPKELMVFDWEEKTILDQINMEDERKKVMNKFKLNG